MQLQKAKKSFQCCLLRVDIGETQLSNSALRFVILAARNSPTVAPLSHIMVHILTLRSSVGPPASFEHPAASKRTPLRNTCWHYCSRHMTASFRRCRVKDVSTYKYLCIHPQRQFFWKLYSIGDIYMGGHSSPLVVYIPHSLRPQSTAL
jgi:hypothetical protein